MTLEIKPHKELEKYFFRIVNTTPAEEPTMFENLKERFMSLWTKPVEFVDNSVLQEHEDGYWGFEMYTPEWKDIDGETVKAIHTSFLEPHNGTWMEVLDNILDAMSNHYGYDLKEQVYYSVAYPLNAIDDETGKPFAGYGRSLNDEVFQQLLLAFPEVYEGYAFDVKPKALFE